MSRGHTCGVSAERRVFCWVRALTASLPLFAPLSAVAFESDPFPARRG